MKYIFEMILNKSYSLSVTKLKKMVKPEWSNRNKNNEHTNNNTTQEVSLYCSIDAQSYWWYYVWYCQKYTREWIHMFAYGNCRGKGNQRTR